MRVKLKPEFGKYLVICTSRRSIKIGAGEIDVEPSIYMKYLKNYVIIVIKETKKLIAVEIAPFDKSIKK